MYRLSAKDRNTTRNNDRVAKLTYQGVTKTMSDWAVVLDVPYASMYARYKHDPCNTEYVMFGLTSTGDEDEVLEPVKRRKTPPITNMITGETKSISDWARELEVSYTVLYERYKIQPNDHLFILFGERKKELVVKIATDKIKLENAATKHTKAKRPAKTKIKPVELPPPYSTMLASSLSTEVKLTFVFRPGFVANGLIWSYDAYLPHHLNVVAVSDICEKNDGTFYYNCENGFDGKTKNEVANKVYQHLILELGDYYTERFKTC